VGQVAVDRRIGGWPLQDQLELGNRVPRALLVEQADAGDIVDQLAVPILADDDAREVFAKVTVAAETILARSLAQLIAGSAARRPQRIVPGQYFGRRTPEDGRIDWSRPAREIHDLVRAVAPPFPGAFAEMGGERWEIHRTRLSDRPAPQPGAWLFGADGGLYAACGGGGVLQLLSVANAQGSIDFPRLSRAFSARRAPLGL
jgi:methionyl-tRNA formyltransferase